MQLLAAMLALVSIHAVQPPAEPAGTPPPAAAVTAAEPDAAERRRLDLDFLAAELPRVHVDAFAYCKEERWRGIVANLRGRIGEMSDSNAAVAMRQVVAMLGDGHTTLWFDGESVIPPPRVYPMACGWFSDGVFAVALPQEHAALLGQELVEVGGKPIRLVLDRLAGMQAHDNQSGRRNQAVQHVREAETLAGLGLIADINRAEYTFIDRGGVRSTIGLAPLERGADAAASIVQRPDPASPDLAVSRRARRAAYGHELLGGSRTLYIWYDTCANRGEKSVAEFCAAALEALDSGLAAEPPKIDRVVIDLRRNGGGDSLLLAPLIDGLARREAINRSGRLFALIGRRTFSSAMMNAWQLSRATKCLLVGEPTGGTPNGFGEVRTFRLPHSRAVVQYSTKRFKGPKSGNAVNPDIPADTDSAKYFDPARDAALEAAMQYVDPAGAEPR